ncbi:hypothetical protein B0T25DRAFT_298746 [Lasiosphaeria hispida]|uniref:Uncharacterized protein n=1 Tax=Lasiosphaeria hispida TaxID=260671 RepID=A0AAJ0H7W6_9PEZI|nr:hypothetical protein B0T25DRAFT_298746 [Lasiosphaeria hispida]
MEHKCAVVTPLMLLPADNVGGPRTARNGAGKNGNHAVGNVSIDRHARLVLQLRQPGRHLRARRRRALVVDRQHHPHQHHLGHLHGHPLITGLGAYLLGLLGKKDPITLCQYIAGTATLNVITDVPSGTVNALAFNGNPEAFRIARFFCH